MKNQWMTSMLQSQVEEIFQEYRDNYRKLSLLNFKKGISHENLSKQVLVKGEPMFSFALCKPPFDWALHTCGLDSYPASLAPANSLRKYWTYQVSLNTEQNAILRDSYQNIQFDRTQFEEAVNSARGLWIDFLFARATQKKNWTTNQTGQIGDVLSIIAPNYFETLNSIFENRHFKKMEKLDPRERKGVISDKLLELFCEEYFECTHFEIRICEICADDFFPQSDREWVGRIPPMFCSVCIEMGFSSSMDFFRRFKYSPEERKDYSIRGVQIYSEYFGFIPSSGNQKRKVITQLFQSGIDLQELQLAMKVSSLLPWRDTVVELFGSWAHFLEASGLLSQRRRGHGGHQSFGSDGHLCLSMGERAICEYLTKSGFVHSKEPYYPKHDLYNPNGLLRGDFLVKGVFIEFAGRMSNAEYAGGMAIKQKLANALGIPWIKLEASSLEDLSQMEAEMNALQENPIGEN